MVVVEAVVAAGGGKYVPKMVALAEILIAEVKVLIVRDSNQTLAITVEVLMKL